MTDLESKALVFIRVFSMFSIILCHLFQTYNLVGYSDIFNMGVQVFLVMSGYLYGYKQIDNWRKWFAKRALRVYFPYLVFFVSVLPLYVLFHPEAIHWKALPLYLANLQGFRFLVGGSFARIEGMRHVWFITAIMCAYLVTPILQKLKRHSGMALSALLLLVVFSYLFLPSLRFVFVFSWVYLYAIGYLFVNLSVKQKTVFMVLCAGSVLGTILSLNWNDLLSVYSLKYRVIHDLIGVFTVVTGVWSLSSIKTLRVPKTIVFLDKYSFYIF